MTPDNRLNKEALINKRLRNQFSLPTPNEDENFNKDPNGMIVLSID